MPRGDGEVPAEGGGAGRPGPVAGGPAVTGTDAPDTHAPGPVPYDEAAVLGRASLPRFRALFAGAVAGILVFAALYALLLLPTAGLYVLRHFAAAVLGLGVVIVPLTLVLGGPVLARMRRRSASLASAVGVFLVLGAVVTALGVMLYGFLERTPIDASVAAGVWVTPVVLAYVLVSAWFTVRLENDPHRRRIVLWTTAVSAAVGLVVVFLGV